MLALPMENFLSDVIRFNGRTNLKLKLYIPLQAWKLPKLAHYLKSPQDNKWATSTGASALPPRFQVEPQTAQISRLASWVWVDCPQERGGKTGAGKGWDSSGKNTGASCHALLQGIFPTQGSNPGLSHCRRVLYYLTPGKPKNTGVGSLSLLQGIFLTQARRHTWPRLGSKKSISELGLY